MKKYSLYIIAIPLAIMSITLFVWLSLKNNKQQDSSESTVTADSLIGLVERHGVLRRASTSGDMRFDYYDIEKERVLDGLEGHPWFFATVADLEDDKSVDDYFDYVQKNKESVFKITGVKEKDDCGYTEGMCYENITIDEIEVVR